MIENFFLYFAHEIVSDTILFDKIALAQWPNFIQYSFLSVKMFVHLAYLIWKVVLVTIVISFEMVCYVMPHLQLPLYLQTLFNTLLHYVKHREIKI